MFLMGPHCGPVFFAAAGCCLAIGGNGMLQIVQCVEAGVDNMSFARLP